MFTLLTLLFGGFIYDTYEVVFLLSEEIPEKHDFRNYSHHCNHFLKHC